MTFLTTRPNVQTRWHSLLQKFKVVVLLFLLMLSGCYDRKGRGEADVMRAEEVLDSADMARRQDSILFARKHHYSENFNFVVKADTLYLMRSQPEEAVSMMPIDTFPVNRHDHLVVADIRIMPNDSIDSVWVQVARDQMTFGWAHESELLPKPWLICCISSGGRMPRLYISTISTVSILHCWRSPWRYQPPCMPVSSFSLLMCGSSSISILP